MMSIAHFSYIAQSGRPYLPVGKEQLSFGVLIFSTMLTSSWSAHILPAGASRGVVVAPRMMVWREDPLLSQ